MGLYRIGEDSAAAATAATGWVDMLDLAELKSRVLDMAALTEFDGMLDTVSLTISLTMRWGGISSGIHPTCCLTVKVGMSCPIVVRLGGIVIELKTMPCVLAAVMASCLYMWSSMGRAVARAVLNQGRVIVEDGA